MGSAVCSGFDGVGLSWRHLSVLGIGWPGQWHLLSHHAAPVLWGQMADDASKADDTQTLMREHPHKNTHTHLQTHLHKCTHTRRVHNQVSLHSAKKGAKQRIDLSPKIIYKVLMECQKVNLGKSGCIMIGAGEIDAPLSLWGSACLFRVKYHHEGTAHSSTSSLSPLQNLFLLYSLSRVPSFCFLLVSLPKSYKKDSSLICEKQQKNKWAKICHWTRYLVMLSTCPGRKGLKGSTNTLWGRM